MHDRPLSTLAIRAEVELVCKLAGPHLDRVIMSSQPDWEVPTHLCTGVFDHHAKEAIRKKEEVGES